MGIRRIVAVAFIGVGDSTLAIARAAEEINRSFGHVVVTPADISQLVAQNEPKFDARLEIEKLLITNPYPEFYEPELLESLYGDNDKHNLKLKARHDANSKHLNKTSSKSKISPRASASLRKGRCRSR